MTASKTLSAFVVAMAACAPSLTFAQDDDKAYLGLGLRVRPAYEGADSRRGQAIPYVRYYGEHLFARTTQGVLEGGIRTRAIGRLTLGAQLAYEEGRVTEESAFLETHNFETLDPGPSAGLHAEVDWTIGPVPFNALVRYRQNLDSDLGAQADFRVTAGIYMSERVRMGVYGQLTFSDGKAAQSYFGVTAQQSAVSGLPVYDAGGGMRFAQFGLLGEADLSGRWLALWALNAHWLQGDARDSPIVLQRVNWYGNAGVAYRF